MFFSDRKARRLEIAFIVGIGAIVSLLNTVWLYLLLKKQISNK